jgi:hypothetical protein
LAHFNTFRKEGFLMAFGGTSDAASHCMRHKFNFSFACSWEMLAAILNGVVADGTAAGTLTG